VSIAPCRYHRGTAIVQIFRLTKRTIDFHTDNARGKLGAATRTEAAIKAASGKLIEP
jgi:DNA-binding NarL/FixJ family response regulator